MCSLFIFVLFIYLFVSFCCCCFLPKSLLRKGLNKIETVISLAKCELTINSRILDIYALISFGEVSRITSSGSKINFEVVNVF